MENPRIGSPHRKPEQEGTPAGPPSAARGNRSVVRMSAQPRPVGREEKSEQSLFPRNSEPQPHAARQSAPHLIFCYDRQKNWGLGSCPPGRNYGHDKYLD